MSDPATGQTAATRTATRQRRETLLTQVRVGNGNIGELARHFNVSVSTVRRDLAVLARAGRVMRTYGGAIEPGHGHERSIRDKESAHHLEKDAIGRTAAGMVGFGDLVLLDAGTTVERLAWHLRGKDGITVVTNGLSALTALADAEGVEVIVLGGRLRRPNGALLGPEVEHALLRFRPDLTFLGADSIHPARGLNCPTPEQAHLKEVMAAAARHAWVLADQSKLDAEPFPYWARPPAGTGIVTNAGACPEAVSALRNAGWRVRIAQPAPSGHQAESPRASQTELLGE